MEKFPLEDGEVRLWQDGLMTVIEADIPKGDRGLVRLAALSETDAQTIGVLIPEQGRLRIKRRLSRRDRELLGLEQIRGFVLLGAEKQTEKAEPEEVNSEKKDSKHRKTETATQREQAAAEKKESQPPSRKESGWFKALDNFDWMETAAPESFFCDKSLAGAAKNISGALTAQQGDMQLLAVPMDSGRPFPPLPVFRYGEPVLIRGESYMLFRLQDGQLVG